MNILSMRRSTVHQYGGERTLLYKETQCIVNSLVNFRVCLDPRMILKSFLIFLNLIK